MKELGSIIRSLRKQKKITLVELSKMTGVAQASLSRIETGIMNGTVESHRKIADALGVSLGELYTGIDERESLIAQKSPTEGTVTVMSENINVKILTTNAVYKKIIPVLITINGGAQTPEETLERAVERFLMVTKGEVVVVINGKEHYIKTNGSLYFDASLPHCLKNKTPETVEIFSVTSDSKI